jgi:hypothetical protein
MILLSRASRVLRWGRQEWVLLAEAWLALLVVRLALYLLKFPRLLALVQKLARYHATPVDSKMLVRAVWRASRLHALPMLCLPRSLALAWMLARRGLSCEVVLGARPKDGALDAHAWVEQAGQPINSPQDSEQQYPVLLRQGF